MAERKKEPRVFLEVDVYVLEKYSAYADWALIAEGATETGGKILTEKMQVEVLLADPDISFCLVASFLNGKHKGDGNKQVKVLFGGVVCSIPLHMINKVIVRP